MTIIDELTSNFSRLPGIGKKSASRIVNWLLRQDRLYLQKFAQNLAVLQDKVKPCPICGAWTEQEFCTICSNNLRDHSIVCVVEEAQDVSTIEAYGEFKGVYHVLGGVLKPLEGIGPSQLNINQLLGRLKQSQIREVIIATNPTVEGDTTALYLNKVILEAGLEQPVKVTRLATGIPVGGDLEYIDKRTLALSFRGRVEF